MRLGATACQKHSRTRSSDTDVKQTVAMKVAEFASIGGEFDSSKTVNTQPHSRQL